jgi:hypothetical protein
MIAFSGTLAIVVTCIVAAVVTTGLALLCIALDWLASRQGPSPVARFAAAVRGRGRRLPRRIPGRPVDGDMTPRDWRELGTIRAGLPLYATERVYAGHRKPWWRRRWRGEVVTVKAQARARRMP